MKIVAIGIGQCGCNIVDEFYAINNYSKSFFGRGIEILTDAFAVNTDDMEKELVLHLAKVVVAVAMVAKEAKQVREHLLL